MLNDFSNENDIVNKVCNELSKKHENVYASIISLKDEIKYFNEKNNELQNKLFDIQALNLETKNTQILFKENLNMEKAKFLCTKLKDKVDRIAGVFSKEDDLYKNMIMRDFEEVKNISKEFNQVCSGNIEENKEKLEEIFKKYE